MISRKRRLGVGLALTLALGVAISLAFQLNMFSTLQRQAEDVLFRSAATGAEPAGAARISLVAIDDMTLQRLGRLGDWDRSVYARAVDRLEDAGARVIVFDILFAEPAAGDETLADSFRRSGKVVLAVARMDKPPPGAAPGGLLRPVPALAAAATTAHAAVTADADGIVRSLPAVIDIPGGYQPSLALRAVAQYLRLGGDLPPLQDGALSMAGRTIPLLSGNRLAVNYINAGFPGASFADVLEGGFDKALFNDRIVLIGVTASGLGDAFPTPAGRLNGVEIHATAAATILTGNFLKPLPSPITLAMIMLVVLACGVAALRLRPLPAGLTASALFIVYILAGITLFHRGFVLNMLYPPVGICVSFVMGSLYQSVSLRAEKRQVTSLFGRYVSAQVAGSVLSELDEGRLRLDAEEREITVAFFDARGFTGMCERTPPELLVRSLNLHLSAVVEAVNRNGGLVNKFGGDSVMALWNAPYACPDHAFRAVRAAVEAQEAMSRLSVSPPMQFGVGISTGAAVAGSIGSEERLEYSVIGDTVNTASRLAGTTPGRTVRVSAGTLATIKDRVRANHAGALLLRGKTDPVEAYEIVALVAPDEKSQRKVV